MNILYRWLKPLTLALLLMAAWPAGLIAQPGMIVEHYTKEDGLPSDVVYSALKDHDGFVWFCTWHGLCTFDGLNFKSYTTRPNHMSDIPPQKVRNMVEDKDGYLWVRNTDNHLYVFDKVTESYHYIYNELKRLSPNVQVIKIQRTGGGRVLVLTRNKNIFEAHVGKDGKVEVEKIFDSKGHIDIPTMRLRHNVLGENSKYVYWLSTHLNISVIEKKDTKPLLAGIKRGETFTAFKHAGQYICAGTAKGDIYIIDTRTRRTWHHRPGSADAPISTVSITGGKLYFTTPSGLYVLSKNGRPSLVTPQASNVSNTFVDQYGKLWLCTTNGLMICHDPRTSAQQSYTLPSDSLFAEMKFMDAGANGLFILQRNGDVWQYDHNSRTMQNVNRLKPLEHDFTTPNFFDIYIDDNGTMWLSSTTNGVYKVRFPKYNFKYLFPDLLTPKKTPNDKAGVRAVCQTRNGDLWVGTRDGNLYCLDIRTKTVKRKFGIDDIGTVYNIMEDRAGNIWFSTKGSGLVKGTPDALAPQGLRLTRYANRRGDPTSLSSDRVYCTYQDSHGRIWVCTFYGGLNLIEERDGKTVFRNKRNGLGSYPKYELYTDVRTMAEDRYGRIWVATTDGLMSFDGNFNNLADIEFETYRGQNNSGATSNDISTIYKDSRGNIWMGIFGNGLNLLEYYDKKRHRPVLKSFTMNEKQDDNIITSIIEDNNHCLWIGTENGVASLSKGSSFMKNYDKFAGLPDITLEENTVECLQDGRILIGSKQGLLAFNPSTVRNDSDTKFKTFIVDFKVMNRDLENFDPPIYEGSVKYAQKIALHHDQNTFTIEFTSPHHTDNTIIPCTYILDGFETQWHNSGSNRIASYSNVPPGHYRFRVKANDNKSPECVLEVVILPPWWATWWAYTIYAVLAALALYGISRTVMYVIRMRNEVYINDRLAELKIRFFTNVSHELRTPLSLIKGPVEELKATERLSPSGKEYLDLIERNSNKMLQLVNQILDFRKIQNGKMRMHMSYVDINKMIEMQMDEFRVLADERDIAFVFEKPDECVMAWCDAEKIGTVLNNLINNAFKFTDYGGTIHIALKYGHDRDTCTISVEDNGVGIPPSQLELIFGRFSQADNKTSGDTTYTGTGIGLSLSKEYVNMHHGRIWAENKADGKGVVFSVGLPTGKEHFKDKNIEVYFDDNTAENSAYDDSQDEAGDRMETAETEATGDVPTVLLVEDNADMLRMLKLQIGSHYNVLTANDGNDGMKKIKQHHPDVIVTDLMMPGMSGLDLLRRVRQDFSISHIPVIVLTAKNTEEDKIKTAKTGANAFIAKPFSSSYLIARIDQLLNEQRIFQRKMVMQTSVDNAADGNTDEYEHHLVKKDIEFMRKIHEVIEQNLNSDNFNIDTIAGTIGLSRSAFFKKLKSLTGFAPVDLVREIRLTKAAHIIETTDRSITDIAYSVGFRDAGYFAKCFRKKFGKTPKEYRNEQRNKG